MKKAYYFLKNYRYDIVATILAILLAWLSFSLSKNPEFNFLFSVGIIIVFLFLIIYLRLRGKDFYFIQLDNRKDKDDWIGNGIFEYARTQKCFIITQSSPGYIYSKSLTWNNYKYEFEFKIRKKCVGAILRAVNLSNYVMLQISQDGIHPHLRINGGWRRWDAQEEGLTFPSRLNRTKWYKCELLVDKDIINIRIYDRKHLIFDEEWTIPQGNIIFEFRREENDPTPVQIPFSINLEYGSGGFRNFGDEKALVKSVLFEKL